MFTARKRTGPDGAERWYWRCTWCNPAASGSTADFNRLLVSLRHHFRARWCHHRYVYRTRGRA